MRPELPLARGGRSAPEPVQPVLARGRVGVDLGGNALEELPRPVDVGRPARRGRRRPVRARARSGSSPGGSGWGSAIGQSCQCRWQDWRTEAVPHEEELRCRSRSASRPRTSRWSTSAARRSACRTCAAARWCWSSTRSPSRRCAPTSGATCATASGRLRRRHRPARDLGGHQARAQAFRPSRRASATTCSATSGRTGPSPRSTGCSSPDRGMATRATFVLDRDGVVRWAVVERHRRRPQPRRLPRRPGRDRLTRGGRLIADPPRRSDPPRDREVLALAEGLRWAASRRFGGSRLRAYPCPRARGAAGSATRLHRVGRRFEPGRAHHCMCVSDAGPLNGRLLQRRGG